MSKIPQGKVRELPAEGTFPAALVQVIDLGTQPSGNPQFRDSRRVQLAFEILGEKTEEGDPFVVYKNYTYSNHPKSSLMKDLAAWLKVKTGDFDMDDALGKPAAITIAHKENDKGTFANITNISALMKGTRVAKHTEPELSLYLDETFDKSVFDKLPEFLRTKIAGTKEYELAVGPKMKKEKPAAKSVAAKSNGKATAKQAPAKTSAKVAAKGSAKKR